VPGVSVELRVVDDPAASCADLLVEVASSRGHLVLAGGSTPRGSYQRAASQAGAWDGATVWFGDERCVPPDDERSNYRMVKEALLNALGSRASVDVHRMPGELGAEAAAQAYERELRDARRPPFDLVLLGIGPDGHTASLFPDQPSLDERARLVVGVPEAGLEPFVPRVSLTLPALAGAARIVFLVSGAGKADAVAAAFGPNASPNPHLPSSLLPPLADEITVLLDQPAAGKL
jgi:6-phosphogluconolactonase